MALTLECRTSVKVRSVACLLCLSSLPGTAAKEPPAEGVEAAPSVSSACEAVVQGLLIGVLVIAAAALKDRCGSALRSLRAKRRAVSQEAARGSPADAMAEANPKQPSPGSITAASPQDKGGRRAKAGRGKGKPDGFGEMLAAARNSGPDAAAATAAEAAGSSPAQRLALPKPGRSARALQMRSKVTEFCSLRFDEVDTTEQTGLTCRMLATLKFFAQDVTYWEEASKIDEPAFSLLGLDEVAQFALLRTAERAEALVEERCWREAYKELCSARPWLPLESHGGPAEEQRAGAMAEMARAEERAKLENEEFEDSFQKNPFDGSAAGKSPGSVSVGIIMRLPDGGCSRVIGDRAATVIAIQAETGARVWLDKATGEAHVSGPADAVEAARRGIKFLLTPVRDGEVTTSSTSTTTPSTSTSTTSPTSIPVAVEKEGTPILRRFFKNGTPRPGRHGPAHARRRR